MVEVKMKRNLLIIISIILCLILNMMFKPTIVKADELNLEETSLKENEDNVNNDEQEDNEIEQELELDEESTNEIESESTTETESNENIERSSKSEKEEGLNEEPTLTPTEEQTETLDTPNEQVENPSEEGLNDVPVVEEPVENTASNEVSLLKEAPTIEPTVESEEPTTSDETKTDEIHGGQVYDITKVKVTISKVDEEGNPLSGAVLQLYKDKVEGDPIVEWTTDGTDYIIELTDGNYIVHEKSAPEGYEVAEDQELPIKVEIQKISAGSDASATPCPHYTGTQMYYVKIKGVKQETYCINQGWNTPDNESIYDGLILNPNDIKEYTKQTVPVNVDPSIKDSNGNYGYGIIYTDGPVDISDPSLTSQQLYDKILDIIYHRLSFGGKIVEKDSNGNDVTYEYTVEEIRFLTEVALKNYTNALLTERQYNVAATDAKIKDMQDAGVTFKTYTDTKGNLKISYIKHNYRDYVYTPDVPLKSDIFKTDYGKGDSFGQMVAGHWNNFTRTDLLHPDATPGQTNHNARDKQADRDTVARYYKLYQLLISSENPHPSDMNLYIYSSKTTPSDPDSPDNKYQNLLGVTGYFEEVEQQKENLEVTNKYSTEKTKATIKKVWDDKNNQDGKRPESITVKLSNGKSVTLNEDNNWEATIENLPKYNKGNLITYTWEEENLPDGYKLNNTEVNGTITTITNSYTPEVRDIKVSKVWYDNDNEYEVRVKEVKVDVIANGEVIKTITLNDDNEWTETLCDLPVYENGKEIKYEVSEFEVENYKVIIEEDKEGFVIYNYYDAKGGETPPPDETPKTGDTIYANVISLVLSSFVFTSSIYIKKRYN